MRLTALSSFSALAAITLLTGCALTNTVTPGPTSGPSITGKVHGGSQIVSDSKIYLYAAGTGGYGTPARSMLSGSGYVPTDDTGSFSISSDYTCQPGDQVYLLALGGNPDPPDGKDNPALALMAALGPCSQLTSSTFIIVNEVTTVAAAYALSGFMGSATQLSSSGTPLALTGVANAFKNAANIASFTTGAAYATTPSGNGTVPLAEINTLADSLAACVNSDGTTGGFCTTLFTAATPPGGTAPTDTVQAALNIAHNPGQGVSDIYGLAAGDGAPFSPTLGRVPNDWSLSVLYTAGGLNQSNGVAVDGNGNVWVTNNNSITELDPTGTPLSPSTGYLTGLESAGYFAGSLALDSSNNAWVGTTKNTGTNTFSGRIVKFGPGGTILSPAGGYTGGGLASIDAGEMAFDNAGNLWVAPAINGSHVAKFSSAGAPLSPTAGFSAGGPIGTAAGMWADTSGDIWVGSFEFAGNGSTLVATTPCGTGEFTVSAIDHLGDIWNPWGPTIYKCDASGVGISPSPGYTDNLNDAEDVAIDGDNRVWYVSETGPIGVMNNAGVVASPVGGYQISAPSLPSNYFGNLPANYFALDGSGNAWVGADGPYVLEYIGIASPVVTPLATGVANSQLGSRP